ncbi:hypothetical protein EK21DRAFT_90243 [Setomelanomma holmii]|uniref:F-box domain-containing protein n=1 Tax=Setomelanomma holmii TaxID=210430 RepID=A0A9P4LLP8_9PLEO|nr:hypothetical protein EK21DRAFT_90243 [Setomelanomma holmii]
MQCSSPPANETYTPPEVIMALLTDLPDELLNDIVDHVFATSPEALHNLTRSCKALHRLCAPLQWKHVVLPWRLNKNSPIARFVDAHIGNHSIRTLRLQPQRSILNAFRIGLKSAFDHVEALCNCMGSLSNLTTFSIFLDGLVDSRCTLPGAVLARIVRSLPPSLAHLELDTECTDRIRDEEPTDDPNNHLCLAISNRVPHLETLRLRLSCICIHLFSSLSSATSPQATSNLRRAFIRLDTSPDGEHHMEVGSEVCDCELPLDKRIYRSSRGCHSALRIDKISEHLLGLQAAGAFPHLERCLLYAWRKNDDAPHKYLHVRDIATRTITRYPKMYTSRLRDWNLADLENKHYELYMIRSHDRADFIGDRKDIEGAALHEVAWRELPTGIRIPPDGRLRHETPHLCEDTLLPYGYLQMVEQDQLNSGAIHQHYLQDRATLTSAAVIVKEIPVPDTTSSFTVALR